MQVTLKLFASLNRYLPANKINTIEAIIQVPDGATVSQVMDIHFIPHPQAHLVMINGKYIPPQYRLNSVLKENDALAICPPVAGG